MLAWAMLATAITAIAIMIATPMAVSTAITTAIIAMVLATSVTAAAGMTISIIRATDFSCSTITAGATRCATITAATGAIVATGGTAKIAGGTTAIEIAMAGVVAIRMVIGEWTRLRGRNAAGAGSAKATMTGIRVAKVSEAVVVADKLVMLPMRSPNQHPALWRNPVAEKGGVAVGRAGKMVRPVPSKRRNPGATVAGEIVVTANQRRQMAGSRRLRRWNALLVQTAPGPNEHNAKILADLTNDRIKNSK